MAAGEADSRLLEEGRGQAKDGNHIEDETPRFLEGCCSCICARRKPDLSDAERDAVWHLRRRVVNNPRPEDEEVLNNIFIGIWNSAFPKEKADTFEVGNHWKRLGFQGKDPKTDVRVGFWCVEQLDSFARHHDAQLRDIVEKSTVGQTEYLFAICCFNITHMLSMFFDLHTTPSVSPLNGVRRATKLQLKHLAQLIVRECQANNVPMSSDICRRVMDELFAEVLIVVHKAWLKMVQAPGGATLMDFVKALHQGFDANASFWQQPCESLSDLKLTDENQF